MDCPDCEIEMDLINEAQSFEDPHQGLTYECPLCGRVDVDYDVEFEED